VKHLPAILIELAWLGAATLFAWYFLWTFIGIEAVAGVVTLILREVERKWK
jgi:hypothetical protein